jgi:hypothetical protein
MTVKYVVVIAQAAHGVNIAIAKIDYEIAGTIL